MRAEQIFIKDEEYVSLVEVLADMNKAIASIKEQLSNHQLDIYQFRGLSNILERKLDELNKKAP